jgi:hypothetical protein
MLSPSQREHLEEIVQQVNPELQIETVTLDTEQTLELVLCNDFVCFRPLRITTQAVDIPAALAGQHEALQALQEWLQSALQGLG